VWAAFAWDLLARQVRLWEVHWWRPPFYRTLPLLSQRASAPWTISCFWICLPEYRQADSIAAPSPGWEKPPPSPSRHPLCWPVVGSLVFLPSARARNFARLLSISFRELAPDPCAQFVRTTQNTSHGASPTCCCQHKQLRCSCPLGPTIRCHVGVVASQSTSQNLRQENYDAASTASAPAHSLCPQLQAMENSLPALSQ
jgi:hypothetical protein